mgnify:CR=1 FL=1
MIKMEKINKIYNQGKSSQVHALKDVDFNVNAGDMVAISGLQVLENQPFFISLQE